jgi:hypothetical protein
MAQDVESGEGEPTAAACSFWTTHLIEEILRTFCRTLAGLSRFTTADDGIDLTAAPLDPNGKCSIDKCSIDKSL